MKRILYTYYTGIPDKNIGGGNRVISEIISNLKLEEYESFYLSDYFKHPTPKSSLNDMLINDGISVQKQWGNYLFKSSSIFRLITLSQSYQYYYLNRIRKKFEFFSERINNFQIIHAHDTLSASIFNSNRNLKKFLTIHSKGSLYADLEDRYYEKINLKKWIKNLQRFEIQNFINSDIVTFPSLAAKKIFFEDLNIKDNNSKKVKIIYNGIDLDSIKKIKSNNILSKYNINSYKYDFIILNVAHHSKLKNIDRILHSINFLKNKYQNNPLLINIGTGYMTKDLLELTNKMNLIENVKFLGGIPNTDVISIIKSSDIFISVASKVIFDLVILEALACGIPVIASNEGGNKEIIKNGVNGYLVNHLDNNEIAQKIIECTKRRLKDSNIILDSKFTLSNMIFQYRNLYNE